MLDLKRVFRSRRNFKINTPAAYNNSMNRHGILTFKPLCANDLPLLCAWLNKPHMRAYYQKEPISLAEVTAKFMPRVQGDVPVYDHLALHDGKPFGKLQCYTNIDHPDYAREVGLRDGISIDLFIGVESMLDRGFGRWMLREYVRTIAFPLYPGEAECFICHDIANLPARACARAAGFWPVREVVEGGVPSALLVFSKPECD